MVCPKGWSLPFGVNLAPRGEIRSLGGMLTPSFSPRGEHSLLFIGMEVQKKIFTPRDTVTPRGQNSTLGDNFVPGGQSLLLGAKLTTGLCWLSQIWRELKGLARKWFEGVCKTFVMHVKCWYTWKTGGCCNINLHSNFNHCKKYVCNAI
jgi:hypothetical protein